MRTIIKVCMLSAIVAGSGVVGGCARVGNDFNIAAADQLEPGKTTYSECVAKLGKPLTVNSMANGQRLAVWSYSTGQSYLVAVQGHYKSVTILFDANNVMVRTVTRSESGSGTNGA